MARPPIEVDPDAIASLDDANAHDLWKQLRDLLDSDETDAWEPVALVVWRDVFHDRGRVEGAWIALVDPPPAPRALARVLDLSGPVPADLKFPLLEQLAVDDDWHDAIVRALWFAIYEDDGDVDVARALHLVERLEPTISASEYEDVTTALRLMPADCRNHAQWRARPDGPDEPPHHVSARAANRLDRRRGDRRSGDGGHRASGERRVSIDRRKGLFGRVRRRR